MPRYPIDAWQIAEYAGAAGGESYEEYLEQLRSRDEAEYRRARARRRP